MYDIDTSSVQWSDSPTREAGFENGRHLYDHLQQAEAEAVERRAENDRPLPDGPPAAGTIPWVLDLSRFVDPADTTQILLWREL